MMATQTITFNDGQMLLPSDRAMADAQPSKFLPNTDGLSAAPLNPIVAEFGATDDPNAPTTVVEYKYDPSEDCDIDCNEIHGDSDSFPTLATPMDVVTAEFHITDDPNAPTSVVNYEYNASEDSDDDDDDNMDSDVEEGWATAVVGQEDSDREDGGWYTAVSHFNDAGDMEVYGIDEGHFAREQASVQPPLFPLTPVRSWGPRGTM